MGGFGNILERIGVLMCLWATLGRLGGCLGGILGRFWGLLRRSKSDQKSDPKIEPDPEGPKTLWSYARTGFRAR